MSRRTSSRYALVCGSKGAVIDSGGQIGNQYYQQVVGIPQGSVLSTLLCKYASFRLTLPPVCAYTHISASFFYGQMERSELSFLSDPSCCLLRLVDDFLLITTNRTLAERFLTKMLTGHPEYGCFVSGEKTLVNFDTSLGGSQPIKKAEEGGGFTWCGYLIDDSTLEVRYDYTRMHATRMWLLLDVRVERRSWS